MPEVIYVHAGGIHYVFKHIRHTVKMEKSLIYLDRITKNLVSVTCNIAPFKCAGMKTRVKRRREEGGRMFNA